MPVTAELFSAKPGFCSDCGSILPRLKNEGDVVCYVCEKFYPATVFEGAKVKYTINFNNVEARTKILMDEEKRKEDSKGEADGPVVERKCPKCGNEKMSYATLQLRSADEGQTVFFTCTKCKFKESENS